MFLATISAYAFLTAAALFGLTVPIRALRALFSDWLPWPYVILVLVSVSWSAVPDLSARYGVELALTAGAALVLARVAPYSFLSALMCAFLVIDVVGLLVGRYALNAGAFAMIGAFGSKNAFSAAQAVLFLTSFWVLLSANQNILMRSLALIECIWLPIFINRRKIYRRGCAGGARDWRYTSHLQHEAAAATCSCNGVVCGGVADHLHFWVSIHF